MYVIDSRIIFLVDPLSIHYCLQFKHNITFQKILREIHTRTNNYAQTDIKEIQQRTSTVKVQDRSNSGHNNSKPPQAIRINYRTLSTDRFNTCRGHITFEKQITFTLSFSRLSTCCISTRGFQSGRWQHSWRFKRQIHRMQRSSI